ncbi:hypothetical protein P7H59_11260 [Enterococcus viikkiensis]|uniref:Uncharacterized protein n=1 Tax=Enterococcus viikkiensis TaxID=930854 RepID=A0ABU3FTP0_9ENTE|nr:hypothetical protein [Enterococcus viikkiensis]MDT2829018.1 hypothetical protein [Enterococcus viikkiensis]
MFQEYSMRIVLGLLLISYGFGLLIWSIYRRMKKRPVDKIPLICGGILILSGILSLVLKSLM